MEAKVVAGNVARHTSYTKTNKIEADTPILKFSCDCDSTEQIMQTPGATVC